jgi:hypothetical protein
MYEKADFDKHSIAFDPNSKDSSFAKGLTEKLLKQTCGFV